MSKLPESVMQMRRIRKMVNQRLVSSKATLAHIQYSLQWDATVRDYTAESWTARMPNDPTTDPAVNPEMWAKLGVMLRREATALLAFADQMERCGVQAAKATRELNAQLTETTPVVL